MDNKYQGLTKIILAIVFIALILYNIYAYRMGGVKATISSVLQEWAYNYPIIVFVLGLILGHILWPVE